MEANIHQCKTCGKRKMKITSHQVGKNKIFKDEFGNIWNGRQCPSCNKDRLAAHMRKVRSSETS